MTARPSSSSSRSPTTTSDDVESIRDAVGRLPDRGRADMTSTSPRKHRPPWQTSRHRSAGFSADLSKPSRIDGIPCLSRSSPLRHPHHRLPLPLLPVIVLFTSVAALSASIFIVWHLADAGILLINGQVQGILFILVVGATTDYSLLVVARFRDALLHERDRVRAGLSALKGVLEPIAASGGTVIADSFSATTSPR